MFQRQSPPFQGGMGFHGDRLHQPLMNQINIPPPMSVGNFPQMRATGSPQMIGNHPQQISGGTPQFLGGMPQMRHRGFPQMNSGTPQMRQGGFSQISGGGAPQMNRGGLPPIRGGTPQMAAAGAAPMRQGGGFLAKLLGKGGSQASGLAGGSLARASSAIPAAEASGGFLKTITNPAAINGFLTNTQKMLNTASQFGPMVQQYGPIVKNIPSMWKLYRGMSSKDSKDKDTNEKNKVKSLKTTLMEQAKTFSGKKTGDEKEQVRSKPIVSQAAEKKIGPPKPRLYI